MLLLLRTRVFLSVIILSITVLGFDGYLLSKYGSHFIFSIIGLVAAVASLVWLLFLNPLAKVFTVAADFAIVSILWVLWLTSFGTYFTSTCNTETLHFQFHVRDIPHDVPNSSGTPKIPTTHVPRGHSEFNVIGCSIPRVAARLTFVPFLILIFYWIILLIEFISEMENRSGRFGQLQSDEANSERLVQSCDPTAGTVYPHQQLMQQVQSPPA